MKQSIAQNKYYCIEVDTQKKRVYIRIVGFWSSPAVVPDYLVHLKKAFDMVAPRFTTVLDCKEMLTHPIEVREKIHEAGVALGIRSGSVYGVQICPTDFIATLQVNKIAEDKQVKAKILDSVEKADEFLDTMEIYYASLQENK